MTNTRKWPYNDTYWGFKTINISIGIMVLQWVFIYAQFQTMRFIVCFEKDKDVSIELSTNGMHFQILKGLPCDIYNFAQN